MVAKIDGGKVTLYSRNGKIISHSYIEVAKALEGVKGGTVIDGELVALDKNGVSHFQLMQNALRREAKLLYCAFDLMFYDGEDLRDLTLLERKKRLKEILPRNKLIAFSRHRKTSGTQFFEEADRKGLEGLMNKGLTIKTGQTHVQAYTKPLLQRIEAGDIDPSFIVTHPANLEDAPAMYKKFRDKEDGVIKVVLRPGR